MIESRRYGSSGPLVYLLHGGPGAAGYLAPVARELAEYCRVVEPMQRRSGHEPLTVARHVRDLHDLIRAETPHEAPVLIGHSWGAMLALACAAEHPGAASAIVLVGCATFDPAARERLREIRAARMTDALRRRERQMLEMFPAPDQRLRAMGSLSELIDSVDRLPHRDELAWCDARGHEETWSDMLRLQETGVYPAAFASIRAPVLMIHGADDPHPGSMIRDSLSPHLPQLAYVELQRCGHYPWLERAARDRFHATLHEWIGGMGC